MNLSQGENITETDCVHNLRLARLRTARPRMWENGLGTAISARQRSGMPQLLAAYPALLKAFRLCRMAMLALALFYAGIIVVNGVPYRGIGFGLIPFTLQSLKTDLFDTVSVESYRLLGYGLGIGVHPTRYAIICEENGQTSEAEDAESERRVRGQLIDNKSGSVYNAMIAAMIRLGAKKQQTGVAREIS